MSNRPLFSIIIPTYNHAHLIRRCLDSIISQTFSDWEAIIINNFSEDNTVEVVESYHDSRIRLINNANNGVIAVSRNKGITEARGYWICFLDSDDWWTSNKLEVCLPYTDDFDFLYHDVFIFRSNNIKIGSHSVMKGRVIDPDSPIVDFMINGNAVVNSSAVLRKTIADAIGPMTEQRELIAVEDMDYWIRVMSQTKRHKYIAQMLGYYYMGSNISASIKQIDRINAIYEKYKKYLLSGEQQKAEARMNYITARLYHMNGKFTEAKKNYVFALCGKYNILKSMIGYTLSILKKKY